jgi:hypothetical protein
MVLTPAILRCIDCPVAAMMWHATIKNIMKTQFNSATARMYYLNNSGSRWVTIDRSGNRETLPVSLDGETVKLRAVLYWEACGNFAYPVIRLKGKAVTLYPDSEVTCTKWLPYSVLYPQSATLSIA